MALTAAYTASFSRFRLSFKMASVKFGPDVLVRIRTYGYHTIHTSQEICDQHLILYFFSAVCRRKGGVALHKHGVNCLFFLKFLETHRFPASV